MAYGTTLARGASDRGQPRRQPGGAHDQACADLGPRRDRRQRLRPAGGDAGREPARAARSTSAPAACTSAISPDDPSVIQVRFFEAPGILVARRHDQGRSSAPYSRQEFRRDLRGRDRRAHATRRGRPSIYVQELLGIARRGRDPRTRAAARPELRATRRPRWSCRRMIGDLGVELIALNALRRRRPEPARLETHEQSLDETARLVRAVGADMGVCMDIAAERIWLVDETGAADPARDDAAPAAARAVGAGRERDAAGAGHRDARWSRSAW